MCESVVGNSVPKCARLRRPRFDQCGTYKVGVACLGVVGACRTSLLAGADIPAKFRILTVESGAKLKHVEKVTHVTHVVTR